MTGTEARGHAVPPALSGAAVAVQTDGMEIEEKNNETSDEDACSTV